MTKDSSHQWKSKHDSWWRGVDYLTHKKWGQGLVDKNLNCKDKIPTKLIVGGYPFHILIDSELKRNFCYYSMEGELEDVEYDKDKLIYYPKIQTSPGQSGGPVCYKYDNDDCEVIVGIHVAGDQSQNWATKWRKELFFWVLKKMNEEFGTCWDENWFK